MRAILILFILLAAFNAHAASSAPCTDDPSLTYQERMSRLLKDECLRNEDARKVSKRLDDMLTNPSGFPLPALVDAIKAVKPLAERNKDALADEPSRKILQLVQDAEEEASKEIRSENADGIAPPPRVLLGPLTTGLWTLDFQSPASTAYLIRKSLESRQCWKAIQTTACDFAYQGAVRNLEVVFLMHRVSNAYIDPIADQYIKDLKANRDKWHAYIYDMQFQYPWELMANKVSDSKPGWPAPPNSRLILLHPDIGVGLANNQPSGNKTQVALQFQWAGYYHWEGYGLDNKPVRPWGLSLVSTVADLASGARVGYGVGFHYKTFTLSATKHGSSYLFLVNLNLLEGIQGKEAAFGGTGQ